MTVRGSWKVIPPDEAPNEIARILALSKLDRKLELVCAPPTFVVSGVNWVFIDVISEPEGFGGRFASTLADQNEGGWLLEATRIRDVWIWEIYYKGTKLSAGGYSNELLTALDSCTTKAFELKEQNQSKCNVFCKHDFGHEQLF